MRILLVGAGGQVGCALQEQARAGSIDLVAAARDEVDLTHRDTIRRALDRHRPGLVVNAAAYTQVERAEAEPERAHAVNAAGAGDLAAITADAAIPLVHLSTDYVFDGLKQGPYVETDPTAPLNVYGESKRAGELAVAAANPQHLILRSAWIYSAFRRNFVSVILDLAKTRTAVRVVNDQIGCPTYAGDIAIALVALAAQIKARPADVPWGTYHLAAQGGASWAQLATAIYEESAARGGPFAGVEPITSAEYPSAARRPFNSRLDTAKLAGAFGIEMPPWRQSVGECVSRLLAGDAPLA